jgi:large subunit ribosomal protein L13
MEKIIVDGDGAIFGRLCSFVAKKALEGNEVIVINSEKTIITGSRQKIIEKFRNLKAKGGHSQKGPKISKYTHLILKRGIRGMLPNFREGNGREAFLRIKCYNGVPKEFEKEKAIKIEIKKPYKSIRLKEVSTNL